MNRTLKKIISGITTLSMCAALIGTMPVSADDPETPTTTKRPLTVEFMGVGNEPAAVGKKAGNLKAENATNKDKFWIAVGVERIHDLPLFTDGVYSLEIAFEYDPAYIRPDAQTGVTEEQKEETWYNDIVAANTASGKEWENYFVESTIETDLELYNDRADKDKLTERANWKMCTVCLTVNEETVQDFRFKDLTSADKQYLIKLPFTVIDTPSEEDPIKNPIVLSLVRGPETFDIGSGADGRSPHAKWNETENKGADENLDTHFEFKGDIQLFGEDKAITDIIPFRDIPQKDENGDPIKDTDDNILTEEETYELSQDTNLNGGEFNPDVDTYYLSISNQPNNLQLKIASSEQVTVTVNGETVNVTLVDGIYVTDAFELDELEQNSDGTYKSDEFRNTVIVSAGGGTPYTIHIRRLLQPRIELMPGNSPYGMIERMGKKYKGDAGWTDEQIAAVKADLMDRNAKQNRYKFKDKITVDGVAINSLPDHAKKDVIYQPIAWSDGVKDTTFHSNNLALDDNWFDKNINMDMNEEALFIYQKRAFTDPGIRVAYDEFGNSIDLDNVKLIAKNIVRLKATLMKEVESTQDYELTVETDPITKDRIISNLTAAGTKVIRPDIYELEYVIQCPGKEDLTATRKLIMLNKRGDSDGNNTVNSSDTTIMREWYQKTNINTLYAGLPSTVSNLHFYRILDMDLNTAVNSSDETLGREIYQKIHTDMPDIYLDVKDLK